MEVFTVSVCVCVCSHMCVLGGMFFRNTKGVFLSHLSYVCSVMLAGDQGCTFLHVCTGSWSCAFACARACAHALI